MHINVDLYEPTKDSLDFFYPRLVKNGVIICNDYGSCKFPGAKKAVDEFLEENNYKYPGGRNNFFPNFLSVWKYRYPGIYSWFFR